MKDSEGPPNRPWCRPKLPHSLFTHFGDSKTSTNNGVILEGTGPQQPFEKDVSRPIKSKMFSIPETVLMVVKR